MGLLQDGAQDWVGRSMTYPPYPVTALDIRKYCYVMGIRDAKHLDPEAARAAGHADVVAPVGYHMVLRHSMPNLVPLDELGHDGSGRDLAPPTTGPVRVMAGETTIEFVEDIVAGDELTLSKTVTDVTEKEGRSGRLGFVTWDVEYRDANDTLKVRETYAAILR